MKIRGHSPPSLQCFCLGSLESWSFKTVYLAPWLFLRGASGKEGLALAGFFLMASLAVDPPCLAQGILLIEPAAHGSRSHNVLSENRLH